MSTLPEYIFVLACRRPKKHKDVLRVLKEYLAEIPHIVGTDTLWDVTATYYVIPDNNTLDRALSNINNCLGKFDIDIYRSALFKRNHYEKVRCKYELWYTQWPKEIPLSIEIKYKDIPTLKLFSEEMKYD